MFAVTMRKRVRDRHDDDSDRLEMHHGSSSARQQPTAKGRLSFLSAKSALILAMMMVGYFSYRWHAGVSMYLAIRRQSLSLNEVDSRQTKSSISLPVMPSRKQLQDIYWFPRVLQYIDAIATRRNDTVVEQKQTSRRNRRIAYPMSNTDHEASSSDYRSGRADPMETDECKPNAAWQTQQYPTCNSIHELSLAGPFHHRVAGNEVIYDLIRMVNNGFWRDVWVVPDYDFQRRVIKTLRYDHDYTARNVERNRRDAMALERLTSSKHVVDVYGYCSTSAFFEFSNGGDINKVIWSEENVTSVRKLQIATQAAMGLADAHTVDFEDRATIAHTDIAGNQYILIDGVYKLNDFNRARFLLRNVTTDTNCFYFVAKNPGKNRSPEEYAYEAQSEKVDVYSFGNVLYTLLQKEFPFQDVRSKTARHQVKSGHRPSVYADVWNSTDPAIKAIKQAMIMCHVQNQTERASMRQVETFLRASLEAIDPGRLKAWGDA
ncbi:hypothetical protein MPSEU_000734300 [Mayamaea pseudoterrestris]|nr:hypothetical protein MPSEU_000734300 [Mayamaea pseudoterrestris]